MRDQAMEEYRNLIDKNEYYISYRNKLRAYIDDKETIAVRVNNEIASNHCEAILSQTSKRLIDNVRNNKYTNENLDKYI